MKNIRYIFEGIFAYLFFYSFRLLSFDRASSLGGKIAKILGPKLKVHKVAENNIKSAMPELSDLEVAGVLEEMWDNLGRAVGEFPHISTLKGKKFWERVEMKGKENIENAKSSGKGFIFFSGHFANWEIAPQSAAELGYPLALIYRPANNKIVDRLIRKSRSNSHSGMFPKGKEGARSILTHLKNGEQIGMLVDQKMNDGIPVKFFGRDAMTASALAEFGLKLDIPIIPARVERIEKTRFKVTVFPALDIEGKTPEEIMLEVNYMFEDWIRKKPSQWFWVHKRWPKS